MKIYNTHFIKYLALLVFISSTSCVFNDDSELNSLLIETGTSFGECIGYCKSTLTLEGSSAKYTEESWRPAEDPAKAVDYIIDDTELSAIQTVMEITDISSLDEVIGCPDCADGGAEWLNISRGGKTKKITFEYGADIKEISALMALLRPLRQRGATLLEAVETKQKVILSEKMANELVLNEYRIKDARIQGAYLLLNLLFDGGCVQHDFELYMAPDVFMESYPVQAQLIIRHDNHGDNCDAVINHEVAFELTPIVERYKMLYNEQTAPIILNIAEYSSEMVQVVYHLTFTPDQ